MSEVERIAARVTYDSSKKKEWLTKKEEEELEQKQEMPTTTLDGYFIQSNTNCI
jgi:hypothetical protein